MFPAKVKPIKVEKKKPTGTKELATIARSLDAIHDGMVQFIETIGRSEEKDSQIAARLEDLAMAIREEGVTEEIEEVLKDIDARVFEERFYTEKGKNGSMRMTDDTKLTHLRAFAAEAAKVAAAKFKMSDGDYTPNAVVVAKLQQSIAIFQKVLKEHLGPKAGDEAVRVAMDEIVGVWE